MISDAEALRITGGNAAAVVELSRRRRIETDERGSEVVVVAAVAVGLFGLAHLVPGVNVLNVPDAARGSGSHGAVPVVARYLWIALAATTVGASIVFGLSADVGALVVIAAGVLGLVVLAITNGVWIHGRPTWTHHAARVAIAVAVVSLAAIAA